MSKLLLARLVLSATLALPCLADAGRPSTPQTLTIFVKGAPAGMPAIRAEVARLMEPAGFAVEWRDMADRRAGEDFPQLATVDFRGKCDTNTAAPPLGSRLEIGGLASTAVVEGQVLPFATVHCDALRKSLHHTLTGLRNDARQATFARAAARVLAHELYHVLAQTKDHGAKGVAKSCFGVADLTAENFQFDRETVAQIRPAPAPVSFGWFEEPVAEDFSGR